MTGGGFGETALPRVGCMPLSWPLSADPINGRGALARPQGVHPERLLRSTRTRMEGWRREGEGQGEMKGTKETKETEEAKETKEGTKRTKGDEGGRKGERQGERGFDGEPVRHTRTGDTRTARRAAPTRCRQRAERVLARCSAVQLFSRPALAEAPASERRPYPRRRTVRAELCAIC